ncbi:hypothetical protein TBLA_0H03620 [Henningerozyma blattae CBS 6284]|uniref:TFIID subunit TAF5 NTD2 domain-containing protein n=1 Tax=Henningerozyma blattae (strain ATCC 34711 / CBS 6284 / DSM 70876 / NBRC 10599 / NRRL Y-10934 / UCD 77-7) TaxID=1071380 RepID=I2H8E2_HENB6|nr:hypothetical protein TBLA_0H03620 [Tetrapisispora blattae CBS 6284]CCH62644.1 hypothetical protein TBLA_0H03620 [Tetrapisispora blattae CBS 6284]
MSQDPSQSAKPNVADTKNAKQANGTSQSSGTPSRPSTGQSKLNGPFSASDLNRIVLEYLNKKGYHRTEAMLRAESGRTLTPQNKNSPASPKSGTLPEPSTTPATAEKHVRPVSNPVPAKRNSDGEIISYENLQNATSPESCIRAYSILKNWVDSSLEIYRSELTYIMYPIFIYMFLTLVAKNPVHARRFFDKYSVDYRVYHGSEINRLFSVNSIDHIKENELASSFQNNKYRVTMSRTTLNLVLYFLNENESVGGSLIISLINQHLEPNVVDTVTSRDKLGDGIKHSTEPGSGTTIDSSINSAPVKLGPFPKEEEFKKEVETELKIKDEQERNQLQKEAGNSEEVEYKKSLVQEYKEMNNEVKKSDTNRDGSNRDEATTNDKDDVNLDDRTSLLTKPKEADMMSPSADSIPLPTKTALDIRLEIQKVRESRESIRLDTNPNSLPSVCMYTFHNTNQDMTSLEFSDDCRLASTGFQDSYIKIWSLDGTSLNTKFTQANKDRNRITITDRSLTHMDNELSATLIGHSGTVYSTSFSPDNRYLISGSEDKTVRLWSLDTHTALVSYKGHNHPIWDVQFSPLGHYFATASHDQTARLWSCDHIFPLRIFAGHLNDVDCVSFHPNGYYVFTGSSDKTCRMWDISTGDSVRLFLGHTSAVVSTAVSPDGRWLTTGSDDGTINVWDIGSGKRLKSLRGHGKNAVYSLTYSKEGNLLVSSGADQSVRVWDLFKPSANANNNPSSGTTNSNPTTDDSEVVDVDWFDTMSTSVNQDIKEYGRRRTVIPTTDLLASFYTKKTPIFKVKFTRSNLVLAGGAYLE